MNRHRLSKILFVFITLLSVSLFSCNGKSNVPTYTITWVNENGTLLEQDLVKENEMPYYSGAKPTKESTKESDFIFNGWFPTIVPAIEPATYTATFKTTPRKYDIKFINSDGTFLKTLKVPYGSVPDYGNPPIKPSDKQYDYTFEKWVPDLTAVTGEATYTASYTKELRNFKIQWKDWDGSTLKEEIVTYGVEPTKPSDPTRQPDKQFTYTFAGWNPTPSAATQDIVYHATYSTTTNKYNVTFKDDDGTQLESKYVPYGETPTYSGGTPTKEKSAYEYTFVGWYPAITPVEDNIVYKARYSKKTAHYEVTWLMDDGVTVIDKESYAYNTTPSHVPPTKEPSGGYYYEFKEWDKPIAPVTCDATYKAVFDKITPDKYPVTFEGTNCLVNGYDSFTDYVEPNSSISYKITPLLGYSYPITLSIFKNGDPLDEQYYSFNANTGEFSMNNVDGFIKLKAVCYN